MYGGSRPGKSRSGVYARRRLLAILLVLILAALLVPRACQALMGSNPDTGSKGKQQANAPGTGTGTESNAGNAQPDDTDKSDTDKSANGAASKNAGKAEESSSPDEKSEAPFLDKRTGNNGSGTGEQAAPDLLALVAPPVASSEGEESAITPSASEGTGGETQAGQQPATEPQNFVIARHEAAEQPPSGEESAPAPQPKKRAAPAAPEPAATPRAAKAIETRDLSPSPPAAFTAPAAVDEAAVPQTAVPQTAVPQTAVPQAIAEPAATDATATLPAAAATPVPAAAPQNSASFVPTPASGAIDRARAIRPATIRPATIRPANLRAGPRLAAPGPAATPRRAVF